MSGLVVLFTPTAASAAGGGPVTHAVSTTTNIAAPTGNGGCLNGGPSAETTDVVNCNLYGHKADVWLSGLPSDLSDGTYFLAVLAPGGQADPNDGSSDLLSTDAMADRTFTMTGGVAAATGSSTHQFFADKVQLAPYADTPNPGGVYILAVCRYTGDPVLPSDCKYDAFKVKFLDAPDNVAEPLTVSKDADGSFKNTYVWSIEKSVDKTLVQRIGGGNATFNYAVKASHDGGTISDVGVSGTITVFNPNLGDVTGVNVTDQLSDTTDCVVTGGSNATIPGTAVVGGGEKTFPYTCTLSALPANEPALDNTVTATWSDQAVDPDGALAAGSADFTFHGIDFTGTAIDECVAVTDTFNGTTGTLGNVCVGDANPTTFSYSRNIPVPANGCLSYGNTAAFTTNDSGATGSSSLTVSVCGPAATGALTMGFWKNTNGQGLIKTYCTNGGQGLGTYLAGLGSGSGPFSTAPATCSGLGTYVTGILNGASATNMNNMLKAQMLASALDVWFSGPGWTATKVAGVKPPSNFLSHNSLGSFNMDTTAVCPMVDNTTAGTATCKNNGPSTDAKASGALPGSPMTMQTILGYAATAPTPFNGVATNSVWYGGDRTKQEVLKNVFDQFNNQLAFGSF